MYLIQILLPLYDNQARPLARALYDQTRDELVERFGGLTAYARAPATGLWKPDDGAPVQDQLVVYEVMAEDVDHRWWQAYRVQLEQRFEQESMVLRAQPVTLL